jgi:CubicO group peptidase (beta-lactamase class C family)
MQRALIVVVILILLIASLAVGTLAAHWPFWQRAWSWQFAADGWPEQLPGPSVMLKAAPNAAPLRVAPDAQLAHIAMGSNTELLMLGDRAGGVRAYFAADRNERSSIDGRGLAAGLIAPLYGALIANGHAGLLDEPVGTRIESWRDTPRGAITPRQLLWQLSGLAAEPFRPLNPASRRAQLASGPDFDRATLHTRLAYPPGSHFDESPANAQVLAVLASKLDGASFAQVLEKDLWARFAAEPATGMLDHRRGHLAAHCCLRASAADWLRLGLLVADDGRANGRQILPAGYVRQMTLSSPVHPGYGLGYRVQAGAGGAPLLVLQTAGRMLIAAPGTGRALLWVGSGMPPAALEQLLWAATSEAGDSTSAK